MKLNTANRAFVALMAISAFAFVAIGVAALALVGVIGYQVATGGSVTMRGHDLRPAGIFVGLVALAFVLGIRSFRRQWTATRELRRRVKTMRVQTPASIAEIVSGTTLRRRIDIVEAAEPFSFAYGLLLPRVVVSTALVTSVTPEELMAVLEHELYHVRNLDPLKVLVARVLPAALFFLPVLKDLKKRYVAGREIQADRRALSQHGRKALAGALYKVVAGPEWSELGAAAAIGGTDLLDVRVSQLETGREPQMPGVSKLMALVSTLGVAVLVWSFAAALADLSGAASPLVQQALPWHGFASPSDAGDWVRTVGSGLRTGVWLWLGVLVYRGFCRRGSARAAVPDAPEA